MTKDHIIEKPKKRITIFDLTRFIAMVLMMQGHTIYAFLDTTTIHTGSFWWLLWELNRGFTAPVFLVVSGAVQIFANKRDEFGNIHKKTFRKRIILGISLVILSLLLHLPGSLMDMLVMSDQRLLRLFEVNILQLIGVCLIMNVILMKFIKSEIAHLIVSGFLILIFSFGGHLIESYKLYEGIHPFFASYFTFNYGSIFPIFPTAAYFFAGIVFGLMLKKTKYEHKSYIRISSLILATTIFIIFYLQHSYQGSFFQSILYMDRLSIGLILFRLSITFVYIFIASFIDELLTKKHIVLMFGKRSLLVYVIHLYFIYNFFLYTPAFQGYFKLNIFDLSKTLLLVFLVVSLTLLSVYMIDFLLKKYKVSKYVFQILIAFIIIVKLFPFF